jgi:hypothetical protein
LSKRPNEKALSNEWRTAIGPASGGERVLTTSAPLFAAASSHYASAGNPHAPRLVTLDEAFAGVDDDSRAKCMGLLAGFDGDRPALPDRGHPGRPGDPVGVDGPPPRASGGRVTRLDRLLGGDEPAWLIARARKRLERGEALDIVVTLPDATEAQRQAVHRLLGRAPRPGRGLSVSLAAVDGLLRRSGAHRTASRRRYSS